MSEHGTWHTVVAVATADAACSAEREKPVRPRKLQAPQAADDGRE